MSPARTEPGNAAMALLRALLAVVLLAGPATAQEYVSVRGALDDDAFYHLVACAAEPGARCRKPFLRWPASRRGDLTVALGDGALRLADWQREIYARALDAALDEINALGADVRLRRVDGVADIAVHVVATPPGRVMRGTGVPGLDGIVLPLARVAVRTRQGEIRAAQIAVSVHARRDEVASIMLEEVVQGLGLITDIRGGAYRRSIFSEDTNSVVRLQGQDAMALRRHYAFPMVVAGRS